MIHSSDVAVFFKQNNHEVLKVVRKVCHKFGIPDQAEDITQTLYLKFITHKILERYQENHANHATKISTYLYRIIENLIKNYRSSTECKIEKNSIEAYEFGEQLPEFFSGDSSLDHLEMHVDYKSTLYSNYSQESIDGIHFDLAMFEDYLAVHDKHYKLNHMHIGPTDGVSILQIYRLLKEGFSSMEISRRYGTSATFITQVKNKIRVLMVKFGIEYNILDNIAE